jgi:protein-tyrosine phosphatase
VVRGQVELPPAARFALLAVDDDQRLFISPAIHDWGPMEAADVRVVIDLEGELDHCVPTLPGHVLYVYLPIYDEALPDLGRLHGVARLAAAQYRAGECVLSHCGLGYNRSALVAGVMLVELGWRGADAVARLRERRPGALFNPAFADYLASL